MKSKLPVIEIFKSIQGESSLAGLPCSFVRTAGCNLHCSYCDTRYAAQEEGEELPLEQIADTVDSLGCRLTCITGGEPLLHAATPALCELLLERGHTVTVETNGTQRIARLPQGVVRVMDVKCPGSGECGRTLPQNLDALRAEDQVKFVICDRNDFDWAVRYVRQHAMLEVCEVLFAPAYGRIAGSVLAEWILQSGLDVRLQLQLHKILWPHRRRGA